MGCFAEIWGHVFRLIQIQHDKTDSHMLALKMEESMWQGRLLGAESSPQQKDNKEGVLVLHPRGTWVLLQPK